MSASDGKAIRLELLRNYIKAKNPGGIPRDDSVQLFLWLFCTLDILPREFRNLVVDWESLVELFEALECDSIVAGRAVEAGKPSTGAIWRELTPKWILSVPDRVDVSFQDRCSNYI
jgi:hypothetical protein